MMTHTKQTPRIAQGLIWRQLDEDAVLVSPRTGDVRVLNGVGTVIWQLLSEEQGIDEIEAYLVNHYQVSLEQAHSDLQKFLNDLIERELVVWEA